MIIRLAHKSVLNKFYQSLLIKVNIPVQKIIGQTGAAQRRHNEQRMIDKPFRAVQTQIGSGDLPSVADCQQIDLLFTGIRQNLLNIHMKLFGTIDRAHAEIHIKIKQHSRIDKLAQIPHDIAFIHCPALVRMRQIIGVVGRFRLAVHRMHIINRTSVRRTAHAVQNRIRFLTDDFRKISRITAGSSQSQPHGKLRNTRQCGLQDRIGIHTPDLFRCAVRILLFQSGRAVAGQQDHRIIRPLRRACRKRQRAQQQRKHQAGCQKVTPILFHFIFPLSCFSPFA